MDSRVSQMFSRKPGQEKMYHSRGYHRYFDGYIERKHTENGKIKIERIYAGEYYHQNITKKQWIWKKVVYLLLFAVCVNLYLAAGTRNTVGNRVWYGFFPQIGINLGLIWLFALLICLLAAPGRMKIRTYRLAVTAFKKACLFNGCLLGCAALTAGIAALLYRDVNWFQELRVISLFLAGSGVMFWLYGMERKAVYLKEPAPVHIQPEDYKIEYD